METKHITPYEICSDIVSLMHQFKMHMAELAETYGLTPIQLCALRAMHPSDGPSQSTIGHVHATVNTMGGLAATLHCDASNVTGIVDRLVTLALITRQENPQDRRVKTLQLTAKGRRVLAAVNADLPSRLHCTALNADERLQLHQLIAKLNPADSKSKTSDIKKL